MSKNEEIKRYDLEKECTACSGSGYYCGRKCGSCNGTGLEYSKDDQITLMIEQMVGMKDQIEQLTKEMDEAVMILKDIRDNYDCDKDAHKYGTSCRCCMAAKFLSTLSKDKEEV